MINLFLILALLNSIMSFFTRKDKMYCGIVGFSGKKPFKSQAVKLLLFYNLDRGKEATGMWNDGKVTKEAISATKFIEKNKIKEENMFLGHTRQPSYGAHRGDEDAHPFEVGKIVSVHNGKIKNYDKLLEEYELNPNDYDVDSEALAALLNASIKERYKVLRRIEGLASIVWINKDHPNVIWCFRKCNERPLWKGTTAEGMYICSMPEALRAADCKNVSSFEVEKIYKIENGKQAGLYKAEHIKPVKAPPPAKNSFSNIKSHTWNDKTRDWEDISKENSKIYRDYSSTDYSKNVKTDKFASSKMVKVPKAMRIGVDISKYDWAKVGQIVAKDSETSQEVQGKVVIIKDIIDSKTLRVTLGPNVEDSFYLSIDDIMYHYKTREGHWGRVMGVSIKGFELGEYVFVRNFRNGNIISVEKKIFDGNSYSFHRGQLRALDTEELEELLKDSRDLNEASIVAKEKIKGVLEKDFDEDELVTEQEKTLVYDSSIKGNLFFKELTSSHLTTLENNELLRTIQSIIMLFKASNTFDTIILKDLMEAIKKATMNSSDIEQKLDIAITKITETTNE